MSLELYLNGQKAKAAWNRSLSFPCRYLLGLSLYQNPGLLLVHSGLKPYSDNAVKGWEKITSIREASCGQNSNWIS